MVNVHLVQQDGLVAVIDSERPDLSPRPKATLGRNRHHHGRRHRAVLIAMAIPITLAWLSACGWRPTF
jgi:hypothetical protein